jgi:hypothetical protein
LDAKAVFFRSRSNEFNVAPAVEDSLGFMNETICHLAPLDLLHVYGKHDVELMAEICGKSVSRQPRFAVRYVQTHWKKTLNPKLPSARNCM